MSNSGPRVRFDGILQKTVVTDDRAGNAVGAPSPFQPLQTIPKAVQMLPLPETPPEASNDNIAQPVVGENMYDRIDRETDEQLRNEAQKQQLPQPPQQVQQQRQQQAQQSIVSDLRRSGGLFRPELRQRRF